MKITKKITSIVLALLLAVSAFAGLAITASAVTVPDGPYTLNITKYQIPGDDNNESTLIGPSGTLTGTEADDPNSDTHGNNYDPLAGVTFTMYKVADLNVKMDIDAAKAKFDAATTGKISGTTGANGKVTLRTSDAGLYYVEETAKPASVTTTSAPFLVYLPMTTQNKALNGLGSTYDGNEWISDVYVYPKNLTSLVGAKLTKTVNNVAYDPTQIKTAPVFKLYAGSDANGTLIATFTLQSSTAAASAVNEITALTADDDATKALKDKYSTVTVGAKGGVIAVDGLPTDNNGTTATYCFIETSGITLADTDSTVIPFNSKAYTFEALKDQSSTIVTDASSDNFGTFTYGAGTAAAYTFRADNSKEPTIGKTVTTSTGTKVQGNGGTYNIGDTVVWDITTDIPADIATYKKYEVTDTIDSALDITEDDITVSGAGIDNLTAGIDYDVTLDGGVLKFEILKFEAAWAEGELTITLSTKINSDAVAVTSTPAGPNDAAAIDNQATLTFTNEIYTDRSKDSDHPYVYTAGLNIVKYETGTTTALDGVEFDLFRIENDAKVAVKLTQGVDGVYYPSTDEYDDNEVVTDDKGAIKVKGLAAGEYVLVETKTKDNYQLLKQDFNYTVNDTSFGTATPIYNVKQPNLPLTGGMGTILFTVAGLALIGGGAFFFIRSRKTRKEEI